MPAPGTCDPASRGQTFNTFEMDFGPVQIIAQYGWDGVSTYATGCDGPVNQVQAINTSATVTYYAHFQGTGTTPHTLALTPGFNTTYTKNQLKQGGLNNYSDLSGLIVNQNSSNDPNTWGGTQLSVIA